MTCRVRFAPSPTGVLHLGSARMALFNYYYAKKHGGKFLLRIEDTDRERSKKEFEEEILSSLKWLGLSWDEDVVYQSQKTARYKSVVDELINEGKAYRCYCTADELNAERELAKKEKRNMLYSGKCRDLKENKDLPFTVRLKIDPAQSIVFEDQIQGRIEVPSSELDDYILLRSDGSPTYQLCVVVDDIDMRISHVIRGADHISNTPKQILLFQALGKEAPLYAHAPLVLGEDKSKLSKRHGAVSVSSYAQEGYLPEAFRNAMMRLGWSYHDEEIFSDSDLKEKFDFDRCGKSPSVFEVKKLQWLNQQYIQKLSLEEFKKYMESALGFKLEKLFPESPDSQAMLLALQARTTIVSDFSEQLKWIDSEFSWEAPHGKQEEKVFRNFDLKSFQGFVKELEDSFPTAESEVFPFIKSYAEAKELSISKLAKPLRLFLTGSMKSPDMGLVVCYLGKAKVLKRLESALKKF